MIQRQATAAAEYRVDLGNGFTLTDAYDVEYLDAEPEQTEAERQALNAEMSRWFGID